MTPETIRIDLRFRGVGRIAKATGSMHPKTVRNIKRMLHALYDAGRLDLLRAIRDGEVTLLEVYDAYRRGKLDELPVGNTMPLLVKAIDRWLVDVEGDYSKNHITNIKTARNHFKKLRPKARVAELPKVLEALRKTEWAKAHAKSFNEARIVALSFARHTLKRSHAVYQGIAAVEPRKRPKRAPGHRWTPKEIAARFPHPETDHIDAVAWTMVTTGMHAKEYWGTWALKADRIHIGGTKQPGRVRDVPLVILPVAPRLSRDWWQRQFRQRHTGVLTPYDLRRTYARWMEDAGIPRVRRRMYMGHGAKDVTDLYERSEVEQFLVADAERLRSFLGTHSPTKTHTIAVEK